MHGRWSAWYRSSHPDPRKNSTTTNMTSSSVRFCFPAKKSDSQVVPNQENNSMEGDQPQQRHSHARQPLQPHYCAQERCLGETGVRLSPLFCAELRFPNDFQGDFWR